MEITMDQETARKFEMINKKIDEINQRRYGLRITKIEDDLDKQELDEYIRALKLTGEQQQLIESFNRSNRRMLQNQSAFYYGMMIVSVFIEAYLGYVITDLLSKPPSTDIANTVYLYLMIAVFIINGFYVLRFLRILR